MRFLHLLHLLLGNVMLKFNSLISFFPLVILSVSILSFSSAQDAGTGFPLDIPLPPQEMTDDTEVKEDLSEGYTHDEVVEILESGEALVTPPILNATIVSDKKKVSPGDNFEVVIELANQGDMPLTLDPNSLEIMMSEGVTLLSSALRDDIVPERGPKRQQHPNKHKRDEEIFTNKSKNQK